MMKKPTLKPAAKKGDLGRPGALGKPLVPKTPTPPAVPAAKLTPREMIGQLAGQIQALATRLEALRAQGAGQTTEFRQLEQMLNMVQDKLLMAQAKLDRR